MLAPRKTLWSTPSEVVTAATRAISLHATGDVVVDVGCGNGTVLIQWAREVSRLAEQQAAANTAANNSSSSSLLVQEVTFIGIDVEEQRIEAAKAAWESVRADLPQQAHGTTNITMRFICGNALECRDLWQPHVTVLFVYLIPRGLRLLQPLLRQANSIRAVASFMNPITAFDTDAATSTLQPTTGCRVSSKQRLRIAVSDETMWPLYIYTMAGDSDGGDFPVAGTDQST